VPGRTSRRAQKDQISVMLWRLPSDEDALQVRFWGVRGSVAVSGPRFAEFGGNTACVEICCGSRLVIVDAGTGLAAFGDGLADGAPAEIDILLSHLHLDHVSGLPFFKPALFGRRLVRTYCGNLGGASARDSLERLYAPPLFPVGLDDLPSRFEHFGFTAGETLELAGGLAVKTHPLHHPGGATGFRFDHRGRSVCYISDIEHTFPWPPPDLVRFVEGADLVIYDGMFSEAEYCTCVGWGHSTWQKGVALAKAAGAKALAIFHLHPSHDDEHLKEVEAAVKATMPGGFVARDGQTLVFAPTR
jgi:phosphoribosyl 1,2-cyclic phosphodiesterase